MGSVLSTVLGWRSEERNHPHLLPITESELLRHPQGPEGYCAELFGIASCVPTEDGENIIIFQQPDEEDRVPNPRARQGWANKRLKKAYELLDGDHLRIVRYMEPSCSFSTCCLL